MERGELLRRVGAPLALVAAVAGGVACSEGGPDLEFEKPTVTTDVYDGVGPSDGLLDGTEEGLGLAVRQDRYVADMRQVVGSAFSMDNVVVISSDFMSQGDINYYERVFVKDGLLYKAFADAPGEEGAPIISEAQYAQVDVYQWGVTLPEAEQDELRSEYNAEGDKLIARASFTTYQAEGIKLTDFYGEGDGLYFSSRSETGEDMTESELMAELIMAQSTLNAINKVLTGIEAA